MYLGSRRFIEELARERVKTAIASGDQVSRVKRIAEYLGIQEYYGKLSPEDKRRLVAEFRAKYGKTAFVGDGINDVEAIAEADVGIAIGSLRIVSNIGDIVLLRGIAGVPLVLRFAHKYMYSIYASIASALVVKLASMIMGLLGYIPMWVVVGLGDDGATLIALGLIGYMLFIPK